MDLFGIFTLLTVRPNLETLPQFVNVFSEYCTRFVVNTVVGCIV